MEDSTNFSWTTLVAEYKVFSLGPQANSLPRITSVTSFFVLSIWISFHNEMFSPVNVLKFAREVESTCYLFICNNIEEQKSTDQAIIRQTFLKKRRHLKSMIQERWHSGYMGNVFTITQSVLFFYHYLWKSLFTVILVLESLEGWYPLSRATLMIMLLRTSVPIKPLGLIISCQRFLRSKILAIEWNAKWSTSEVTL